MSTITPSMSLPGAMPYLPDSHYAGAQTQMGHGVHAPPVRHAGHAPAGGHAHHAPPATGRAGHSAAAGHGGSAGQSPHAVGKGFEEMFASILIKHMRQTVGEHGLFGHDPGDVLGGMFDHFMSQHIAHHGSMGIGKMIEKHLEHRSEKS